MNKELLGTDLIVAQTKTKCFNLDTILLADFVFEDNKAKMILDFGAGSGALMLYLSQKTKAKIIGLEIQKFEVENCQKNIVLNKLEERLEIQHLDINEAFKSFKDVDIVVSNPPFFKRNNDFKINSDIDKAIARHEILISLEQLVLAASKVLRFHGKFYLIHRPKRILEICAVLKKYNFSIKNMRFVHPYFHKPANHVMIEAIYGGKNEPTILAPLIVYSEKFQLSAEMKKIYRRL